MDTFAKTMNYGIPKIIHQTCGDKKLPKLILDQIAALRAMNPGWEYRFYSDQAVADYIGQHFPEHLATYLRINPSYGAARADFFRYLLMYREGGVYLDIKSTFSRPLGEVILPTDCYLLSHWANQTGTPYELWGTYKEIANPRGEFQQCFIVAAPGHPFLQAVIDRVANNIEQYDPERDGVGERVVYITGPVAYTLAITPLLEAHDYRMTDSESELSFVYHSYKRVIGMEHWELFDQHYRTLDEAIVSGR